MLTGRYGRIDTSANSHVVHAGRYMYPSAHRQQLRKDLGINAAMHYRRNHALLELIRSNIAPLSRQSADTSIRYSKNRSLTPLLDSRIDTAILSSSVIKGRVPRSSAELRKQYHDFTLAANRYASLGEVHVEIGLV